MTDIGPRHAKLKDELNRRRSEILIDVRSRLRDGRADRTTDVQDELDGADAYLQGDLALALLQLRSETLTHIDAALGRIDGGHYGFCSECEDEIAERRLRALPFAVRCQACAERREQRLKFDQRRATRGVVPMPSGEG